MYGQDPARDALYADEWAYDVPANEAAADAASCPNPYRALVANVPGMGLPGFDTPYPPVSYSDSLRSLARRIASEEYGLDPDELEAIIDAEMGAYWNSAGKLVRGVWRPWQVGNDNDTGLGQLIPSIHWQGKPVGSAVCLTGLFDPATNLRAAAAYLRECRNASLSRGFPADTAYASYNGGHLSSSLADHPAAAQVYRNKVVALIADRKRTRRNLAIATGISAGALAVVKGLV